MHLQWSLKVQKFNFLYGQFETYDGYSFVQVDDRYEKLVFMETPCRGPVLSVIKKGGSLPEISSNMALKFHS